jgi:hypothetical protein
MCIFHNIEGPEQGSELKVERRFTSSEGCESGLSRRLIRLWRRIGRPCIHSSHGRGDVLDLCSLVRQASEALRRIERRSRGTLAPTQFRAEQIHSWRETVDVDPQGAVRDER